MGSDLSTHIKECKKSTDAHVCEDYQKVWKRHQKEWERGNKDTERYVVRRRASKAVYQENVNQKDLDLQMLVYKMITNMKSSRLQQNGQNQLRIYW